MSCCNYRDDYLEQVARAEKAEAEVERLRAIAEQAIQYHDDCGHEQYEDRRQCDPICTAAIAWRDSTSAPHTCPSCDAPVAVEGTCAKCET